jgi:hypothetical protein
MVGTSSTGLPCQADVELAVLRSRSRYFTAVSVD